MIRIIGMTIGVIWLGLAFLALQRSLSGWDQGYTDIGFWWAVIASLLAIAAVGALVGTWIHTRPRRG